MNYSIYQLAIFDFISDASKGSLIIEAVAGAGKCLGYNTPVLMFDGTIKMVQDIVPGEFLMGPDSKPREVLNTNVGYGNLFRISPTKGDSWICNDAHILTLVNSVTGEVFDIPIMDYLKNIGTRRCSDAKLFRVSVDYHEQPVFLDPYFAGLWLGDGNTSGPTITNKDIEIQEYLKGYAPSFGLTAKVKVYGSKCPKIDMTGINFSKKKNLIRNELLNFVVDGKKRIPQNYLINSEYNRLRLLAGLIDSDGYYHKGCYEISTKLEGLKEDILHLCRGLGFAAYAKLRTKTVKSIGFSGKYWIISISGNCQKIPCLLGRKKSSSRLQKKDVLRTGFKVEAIGPDNYYGFTLSGDGRFLLGDYTVTHNTSTIVKATEYIPKGKSVLFLAFNVSIVQELKSRLPSHVKCQTFNGCGWGAWISFTGKKHLKIDSNKTYQIIKNKFEENDFHLYSSFAKKMVALAKSSGLTPEDTDEKWMEVANHHDLEMTSTEANFERGIFLAKKTLAESIRISGEICDFDDQIYMPYLRNANFSKYDFVFIDEAQDTSEIQIELLKRMLKPGGKLIAVGDPYQAIYGFRGADSDSMNKIRRSFSADTLPLSISYRCCKSVVTAAQAYMPDIQAYEGAQEGEVTSLPKYRIEDFTNNDAVLCRNNAPLIKFAYQVIARGKGVNFLGRDLGGNLKTLIQNLEAASIEELEVKMEKWLSRESAKAAEKGQEDKIQSLEDKVNCIQVFIQYLPESKRTIEDLILAIDFLFSREGGLTLASAHRSKGKEWKRVFILDSHLMPSPYAKKEWMQKQERNLTYVAITRAKEYLAYIDSDQWEDQPNMILPDKTVRPIPPKKEVKTPKVVGFKLNGSKLNR